MRLTGITYMSIGLSMVGYAVTCLRYVRDHHITVPASAPLLDQVVWLLTLDCLVSVVALGAPAGAVRWGHAVQNRRARH